MRYIRYASIAIFGVAIVTIALANREMVTVQMLPPELASVSANNPSLQLPLFAVILGSILVGLLVGFVWEFMIEQRNKSTLKRENAELKRLRGEIARLKAEKHAGKDEVLALLDEAS